MRRRSPLRTHQVRAYTALAETETPGLSVDRQTRIHVNAREAVTGTQAHHQADDDNRTKERGARLRLGQTFWVPRQPEKFFSDHDTASATPERYRFIVHWAGRPCEPCPFIWILSSTSPSLRNGLGPMMRIVQDRRGHTHFPLSWAIMDADSDSGSQFRSFNPYKLYNLSLS